MLQEVDKDTLVDTQHRDIHKSTSKTYIHAQLDIQRLTYKHIQHIFTHTCRDTNRDIFANTYTTYIHTHK
jgi:hypothetical protein